MSPAELDETFVFTADPSAAPDSTISPLAIETARTLDGLPAAAAVDQTLDGQLADLAAQSTDHPSRNTTRRQLQQTHATVSLLPRLTLAHQQDHSEISDIEIRGVLGEGGMGRVELGYQPALDRDVAVKRVRPDRECAAALRALLQEAQITGSLEHPNIIPMHMLGQDADGKPLLVMKRVEGVVWRDLIRQSDHPAWAALGRDRQRQHVDILLAVCNAVQYAHKRGILHRDLKTENVMVGEFGEVYVLDWGIAVRLAAPPNAELAGTPAFMAPEMLDGTSRISEKSDVYLMGSMLHEVLTGQPRHKGHTTLEVLRAAQLSEIPVYSADVPHELAAICRTATQLDPALRPQNVAAFKALLADYLQHRGSVSLADQANVALAQLPAAVAAADLGATRNRSAQAQAPNRSEDLSADGLRSRVRALIAEAAFGFRQALTLWAENVAARQGLQRCLALACDFELDQHNAAGAETHLGGIEPPDVTRQQRVADLRALLRQEQAANAALIKIAHDTNEHVGSNQRNLAFIGLNCAFGTAMAILAYLGKEPTPLNFILAPGMWILLYGATVWFGRRAFLGNKMNRQLVKSVFSFLAIMLYQGILAYHFDQPVAQTAMENFEVYTLWGLVLGITVSPNGLVFVPAGFPAMALLLLWPGHVTAVLSIFAFSIAMCSVAYILVLRRAARRA